MYSTILEARSEAGIVLLVLVLIALFAILIPVAAAENAKFALRHYRSWARGAAPDRTPES